jgi:NADPH-dependent ferric siderophore reductase
MTPEEFLACVVAIKKYLEDKKNMPNEVIRGISYWKKVGRLRL